ncbi:MAG: DNA repair protein RecN [Christensenellales bacterium]|jgi:DNA repair protein RecN (Recombination protein N)
MLRRLSVRHIALIEKADITFERGLCVLTGETGAGKSILVDAMKLALGGRADRDLISAGEKRAQVEAAFFVKKDDPVREVLRRESLLDDDEEELVLWRELTAAGRSTCRIAGTLVTLSLLREISSHLVDIYGQHDYQSLLNPASHRAFLDRMDREGILSALKEKLAALCAQAAELKKKMSQGYLSPQERERQLDILRFQLDEIRQAGLQDGEEEELKRRQALLAAAEEIDTQLAAACDKLAAPSPASALDFLGDAVQAMARIAHLDASFEELHARLEGAYYDLEDAASALRRLTDTQRYDPQALSGVEMRLDEIYKLKRKYGATIAEILRFADEAEAKIAELEGAQEHMLAYQKQYDDMLRSYHETAVALSSRRQELAKVLERELIRQLSDLGMDKAQFSVHFGVLPDKDSIENHLSPEGLDEVEFYISFNPGVPVRPMARVISGGELSRVMLALKNVPRSGGDVGCMIFDEIDAGIGGRTANVVAKKMKAVSKERQVLCVTHLAAVAAAADMHIAVEKASGSGATKTGIAVLGEEAHLEEIARMLGGDDKDSVTLAHARKLVKDMGNHRRQQGKAAEK